MENFILDLGFTIILFEHICLFLDLTSASEFILNWTVPGVVLDIHYEPDGYHVTIAETTQHNKTIHNTSKYKTLNEDI